MSLKTLPSIKAFERPKCVEADTIEPSVLDRWEAGVRSAANADEIIIDILDVIGEDFWTGQGVTVRSVKAQLNGSAGPVTVNINSPGGDFFEGLGIYNVLREHQSRVTVNIIGLAGSAASVVAMAGDKKRIAKAGFLFIHDCWVIAMGNRHDLSEVATVMAQFDDAMADLYATQSGQTKEQCTKWMDAETWFGGQEAVDKGFCDSLLPSDAVKQDPAARAEKQPILALRRTDAIMAKQGVTKSERRRLLNEIKSGTSGAAAREAMQDAGRLSAIAAELRTLHATFR